MPVIIVVGVQWGDEGKGKVVDYITETASLVVRFQGGDNAGHTVVVSGHKTALRLIPSGILRPGTRCLLASGVVLNPITLLEEMAALQSAGVSVTPDRFGIAGEVQLILPYHLAVDRAREAALAGGKIGTTGKGIGPAYEDAVSRSGIRVADLYREKHLRGMIERNVETKNRYLKSVLNVSDSFNANEIFGSLTELASKLKPFVTDVSVEVTNAVAKKKFIVFEGAQGSLLDVNHGTYPYVTSSNTVAGFACASAGISPKFVDRIVGICKAYSTRVGGGPFPTEELNDIGDSLRKRGNEYGTVTGRPRRCGWFDAVAVRTALRLNGIESLILTKLDVLSRFPKIRLAMAYSSNGEVHSDFTSLGPDLETVTPVYEELDGWDDDISAVRSFAELPQNAKKFVERIEQAVNCEIGGFSVGPDRAQTVVRSEILRKMMQP